MNKYLTYIYLILTVLTTAACSDEILGMEGELSDKNTVVLSANSSKLITKAGLQFTNFDVYTEYLLYCIENSESYDWKSNVMYDRRGWENEQQLIEYGKDMFFDGKKLDFYGATLCSTRGIPYNINNRVGDPGSPVIGFDLATYGEAFPDLMYSNNLKGCTSRMGILEMDFTHALSKIQVEIARQEITDLEGMKLKSVSLVNTYGSGELDIVNGTWANRKTETAEGISTEIVITDEETEVPVDPVMLKKGGNDAFAYIIPNENSSEVVSVKIVLLTASGEEKVFTYPLYASPEDGSEEQSAPFIFKQNHRYVLSIILLDEGVRVVAVSPQMYDWIDVPVDTYMGQPVNFGGLMWMDRNLGAESADCENDWARTRGFYYQFGRNIPYIFDQEKFKYRDPSAKTVFRQRTGKTDQLDIGYEYFFTYNEKGERVYGAVQGGTQTWFYFYHVSALDVNGTEIGWDNPNGAGWVWRGSQLINYKQTNVPHFYQSNGDFSNGAFWTVEQAGVDGSTSNNKTEDPKAPQWLGPNVTTSNIAINPGDPGVYHFIFDARYYTDYLQSGAWCVKDCLTPGWEHWRPMSLTEWEAYNWEGGGYPVFSYWMLNQGCVESRIEDTQKVNYYWTGEWNEPLPENHPCPKGWRIPTKQDFAGILPDHNIQNSWAQNENTMYVLQETIGDVLPYYEAAAYGVDHLGRKVIYLIKRKGEGECYRLRLLWKDSKLTRNEYYNLGSTSGDHNMQYLEISRYPGNSSMSFDKYYNAEVGELGTTNVGGTSSIEGVSINKSVRIMTGDELNNLGFLTDFNWNDATETIQIPICGFIYPALGVDGMFEDGEMTILRCTDWSTNYDLAQKLKDGETYANGAYPYNEAMNWCAYIRTDRNTGLFSGSRKSLGDQIRCVRDVNAK